MRQFVGCCRQAQNLAKEQRRMSCQVSRPSASYPAQTTDLKELRDDPEIAPWLSRVPSQILQQALRDTDIAFQRFLSGAAGYPDWKRKGGMESFRDRRA